MIIMNQLFYPLHALPSRIHAAALKTSRNAQVTDILGAAACFTALSVAVSPLVDWRHPLSGQVRPCVLNQAIAAISGDRKSRAEELACGPIYENDREVLLAQDAAAKTYASDRSVWAAVRKGLLARLSKLTCAGECTEELDAKLREHDAHEPVKPVAHRVIYQEVTRVSMFEALEGDGKALALLTDEGQTLLDSTVMRHYGFLNNVWDGKPLLTFDRANTESIIVQNPRVTVSFMIQPDVLASFFAKRGAIVRESGFCARYLFSRSPSIQGFRPPTVSPPLKDLLPFHARIRELQVAYQTMMSSGSIAREVLDFTDEAKIRWLQIASNVEAGFQPGQYLHDISDFGNKYMDMVGRIACLLHYFERSTAGGDNENQLEAEAYGNEISADILGRASLIAEWHLHEYKQLFSEAGRRTPEQLDADRLYAYLYRNFHSINVGKAAKNAVRQYCGLRGHGRFEAALGLLLSWQAVQIVPETIGESKKATHFLHLNFGYFASHAVF